MALANGSRMTVIAARMVKITVVVGLALVVLNECTCIGSCIEGSNDSDGCLMVPLGAERVAAVALVNVTMTMLVHCGRSGDNIVSRIYGNGG